MDSSIQTDTLVLICLTVLAFSDKSNLQTTWFAIAALFVFVRVIYREVLDNAAPTESHDPPHRAVSTAPSQAEDIMSLYKDCANECSQKGKPFVMSRGYG